jgi:hypothetical protein
MRSPDTLGQGRALPLPHVHRLRDPNLRPSAGGGEWHRSTAASLAAGNGIQRKRALQNSESSWIASSQSGLRLDPQSAVRSRAQRNASTALDLANPAADRDIDKSQRSFAHFAARARR